MKTFIFSSLLFIAFSFTYAQSIYSMNGLEGEKGISFQGIADLNSERVVFDTNNDYTAYKNGVRNFQMDAPNSKLMASLAFDVNTNKVIFMPMISSYVYVQDLKTNQLTSIDALREIHVAACDQGSQFSRMTMAPDGNAYALNNNFSELIRINPRNSTVENLGTVKIQGVDPNEDKSFWGGDLVADSQNNLYVISAFGHIFKVDMNSQSAEKIGELQGLPANYTSNGAAVLSDGSIIIGNAQGNALYQFTLNNTQVKKYRDGSKPCYDLASQFFIPVAGIENPDENLTGIQLYPTLVDQKEINLVSNKDFRGVTVRVYDINSMVVAEFSPKSLNSNVENTYSLNNLKPNIYIVKAFDQDGNEILNQKVTVSR